MFVSEMQLCIVKCYHGKKAGIMSGCRVLIEVHPDVGISKQGMQVMQTFATDMFDRIMVEAARLCRISKKATLSSREIQTAGVHTLPVLSIEAQA